MSRDNKKTFFFQGLIPHIDFLNSLQLPDFVRGNCTIMMELVQGTAYLASLVIYFASWFIFVIKINLMGIKKALNL